MPGDNVNQVAIERDLSIPLSDGQRLAADLFRPAAGGPFPTLISFYPYHKDDFIGAGLNPAMAYFAAHGYAHLLVDFRGVGGSSGIAWEMMDRREGRDGAEAVEWAARQSWSNGNVGMWGLSYGGYSSLKTAAEGPPHLKAIVPMEGGTDIYHDYLFPGGCFNCLGAFGAWGSFMLAMNLMPPTRVDAAGEWYAAWLQRLESGQPYVLPWSDHPAHDRYWDERAVDPAQISIPTFIVGGWRDIFPEAVPSIYAQLAGPKKLLMGPWMHTMPETAANEPIEFLPQMKRWFDYWLRREQNGIVDEPPVTIYVQGANVWHHEQDWPPPGVRRTLYLAANGSLAADAEREEGAESYTVDPTVGTCAGLWDPTGLGVGMPLEQTLDDLRSLTFTTTPLDDDTEVTGAGELRLHAAFKRGDEANLVAKLCDVDAAGKSTLISTGMLKASHRKGSAQSAPLQGGEVYEFPIRLFSTSYLIRRGHRVRVSISGADFPHIWPTPSNPEIQVFWGGEHASSLMLPVVSRTEDLRGPIPQANFNRPVATMTPRYRIETDFVAGTVSVVTGQKSALPMPAGGILELDHTASARVHRDRPDQATVEAETRITAQVARLGELEVKTSSWFSHARTIMNARVMLDGRPVFERTWRK
jgi:putative CocE/NonD family hydrolase